MLALFVTTSDQVPSVCAVQSESLSTHRFVYSACLGGRQSHWLKARSPPSTGSRGREWGQRQCLLHIPQDDRPASLQTLPQLLLLMNMRQYATDNYWFLKFNKALLPFWWTCTSTQWTTISFQSSIKPCSLSDEHAPVHNGKLLVFKAQ